MNDTKPPVFTYGSNAGVNSGKTCIRHCESNWRLPPVRRPTRCPSRGAVFGQSEEARRSHMPLWKVRLGSLKVRRVKFQQPVPMLEVSSLEQAQTLTYFKTPCIRSPFLRPTHVTSWLTITPHVNISIRGRYFIYLGTVQLSLQSMTQNITSANQALSEQVNLLLNITP